MRAGDHLLAGRSPSLLATLSGQRLHDKVDDDDGDNQEEELAQAALS
jgi:hypothetical protein